MSCCRHVSILPLLPVQCFRYIPFYLQSATQIFYPSRFTSQGTMYCTPRGARWVQKKIRELKQVRNLFIYFPLTDTQSTLNPEGIDNSKALIFSLLSNHRKASHVRRTSHNLDRRHEEKNGRYMLPVDAL